MINALFVRHSNEFSSLRSPSYVETCSQVTYNYEIKYAEITYCNKVRNLGLLNNNFICKLFRELKTHCRFVYL